MGAERTRSTAQATAEGLRVFVAGISWKIGEETLRNDFEECGVIEDLFLLRDGDGNSRGRAFVTFRDAEAVKAALAYDNTDYAGRKIFVKIAEAKRAEAKQAAARGKEEGKDGAPAAKQAANRPKEKPEGCTSLCLKSIGEATEDDVRKLLDGCTVQAVRLVIDRSTGLPRGIAFVDFPNTKEVDKAMQHNGKKLGERAVEMHYEAPRARPRPEGCLCVAIKKLDPNASDKHVRKLFEGLASLADVRLIRGADGKCTGLAFAEFGEPADVEAAIRRDGMAVKGQTVFICYETKQKRDRPPRDAPGQAPAEEERPKKKRPKPAGGAPSGGGAAAHPAEPAAAAQRRGPKRKGRCRARRCTGGSP